MIEITDRDIKEVADKFADLKKKYPDLVKDVSAADLRKVADYLNDPIDSYREIEAWERIKRGNIYGYSIFLHEKYEIEVIEKLIKEGVIRNQYEGVRKQRIKCHGKGLFEQYKFLQSYIYDLSGKKYSLTALCNCDVWGVSKFEYDLKNAKKLRDYLRKYGELWYNKHEKYPWLKSEELKILIEKLRSED